MVFLETIQTTLKLAAKLQLSQNFQLIITYVKRVMSYYGTDTWAMKEQVSKFVCMEASTEW